MNKSHNFVLIFFIILLSSQNIIKTSGNGDGTTTQPTIHGLGQQGAGGYELGQITPGVTTAATQNASCSAAGGTCCQSGQQCCASCAENDTTTASIPAFNVQITNAQGAILNSQPATTNTPATSGTILNPGFSIPTAILIIQIFPPSNTIASSVVTPAGEQNYVIMYTIKSPSGSNLLISYELIPASKGVPSAITIPSVTGSTNTASITPIPSTNIAAFVSLFPSTITADSDKLTILNGISPMTQKFLITNSATQTFTITPISGISNSEITESYTISNGAKTFFDGGSFNLTVSLDGQSSLFTFSGSKIPFTTADLTNGLILNVIIYPSNNNNYRVMATLRSKDGSKYRKQYALDSSTNPQPYSSSTPSTLYIGNTNNISAFKRTFFNPSAPSSLTSGSNTINPFNFVAPISLKFLITQ